MRSSSKEPLLSTVLRELLERDASSGLRLGAIIEAAGERSFGLMLGLLALPSALPIPAIGYSVPFGLMIIMLGVQMLRPVRRGFQRRPWLPARMLAYKIKRSTAEKMISFMLKVFQCIESFIHPRLPWLQRRTGRGIAGFIVILMGLLMAIPLPSTNTLPAMIVWFTALGLTEEDGLLLLFAAVAGVAAVFVYGLLLVAVFSVLLGS